jgi:hypothetical protein
LNVHDYPLIKLLIDTESDLKAKENLAAIFNQGFLLEELKEQVKDGKMEGIEALKYHYGKA